MDTAPLTQTVDRSVARYGPTTLRWLAALLWLSNVSWKVPPDFGSLNGYVRAGSQHPVILGAPWVFEHVIGPHLNIFGWVTLLVETSLVVLLLSGRYLRVAAVLGFIQSFAIMAAVANADREWYWSYLLMMALHVAILVTAPVARPVRARGAAFVLVGYGALVTVAHLGAGLTGDGNRDWTLFGQRNGLPGDFGRNVFPGSILLGLLLVAVGVVIFVMRDRLAEKVTNRIGWAMVAASGVLLLTYGTDGLVIRLGSKASTVAVLGGVGLALARQGHAETPVAAVPSEQQAPREVHADG